MCMYPPPGINKERSAAAAIQHAQLKALHGPRRCLNVSKIPHLEALPWGEQACTLQLGLGKPRIVMLTRSFAVRATNHAYCRQPRGYKTQVPILPAVVKSAALQSCVLVGLRGIRCCFSESSSDQL